MYYKTRQLGNKYNNVKQTVGGYSYDSKKEAAYAMFLESEKKAKRIKNWERQLKIELKGENGSKICNYYIDFVVTHNDDTLEFVEIKGFETDVWKLKWKLFNDKYGKDAAKKLTVIKV